MAVKVVNGLYSLYLFFYLRDKANSLPFEFFIEHGSELQQHSSFVSADCAHIFSYVKSFFMEVEIEVEKTSHTNLAMKLDSHVKWIN